MSQLILKELKIDKKYLQHISILIFNFQTKIRFEQIKTNRKFSWKKAGFVDWDQNLQMLEFSCHTTWYGRAVNTKGAGGSSYVPPQFLADPYFKLGGGRLCPPHYYLPPPPAPSKGFQTFLRSWRLAFLPGLRRLSNQLEVEKIEACVYFLIEAFQNKIS